MVSFPPCFAVFNQANPNVKWVYSCFFLFFAVVFGSFQACFDEKKIFKKGEIF